LVDIKI